MLLLPPMVCFYSSSAGRSLAMETVSEVGKMMPPDRKALAEDGHVAPQVVDVKESPDTITAQLMLPESQRLYKNGGRPIQLPGQPSVDVQRLPFPGAEGAGTMPGSLSRYATAVLRDPRMKLSDGDMCFIFLGDSIDHTFPSPTTELLIEDDMLQRNSARPGSQTYDNHLAVQTTLAGMANPAYSLEGPLYPQDKKEEIGARLLSLRIRPIGIVTPVDSNQSDNGRTVAHVGAPKTFKNVWKDDYLPGEMMKWVALPQAELNNCEVPQGEKDGNPKLVPVPVRWLEHDLGYKVAFDLLVADERVEATSLYAKLRERHALRTDAQLGPADFGSQYARAWYHLFVSMVNGGHFKKAARGLPAGDMFPDMLSDAERNAMNGRVRLNWHSTNLRVAELIAIYHGFSDDQWQQTVVRSLLAFREISLQHDMCVFGRNLRYAKPRDQSLVHPLSLGTY